MYKTICKTNPAYTLNKKLSLQQSRGNTAQTKHRPRFRRIWSRPDVVLPCKELAHPTTAAEALMWWWREWGGNPITSGIGKQTCQRGSSRALHACLFRHPCAYVPYWWGTCCSAPRDCRGPISTGAHLVLVAKPICCHGTAGRAQRRGAPPLLLPLCAHCRPFGRCRLGCRPRSQQ